MEAIIPKYKNAAGQPVEVCKTAAFQLVTDFGATQAAVAEVMKTTQPTIHNWCKEMGFRKEISGLKTEVKRAHKYIDELRDQMGFIQYQPEEDV
jgi:hypothetical protein